MYDHFSAKFKFIGLILKERFLSLTQAEPHGDPKIDGLCFVRFQWLFHQALNRYVGRYLLLSILLSITVRPT